MDNRDKRLTIEIKDGVLSISIGVERLKYCQNVILDEEFFCAKMSGKRSRKIKITNADEFVKDFKAAALKEDDLGNSLLTKFIDAASQEALNDGAQGVEYSKLLP